ncbi:transglutaminase family protein [Aeromicrobium halocynthiae]|uniref:Transglutaminase family protein n=1 Tax=Aeromicrobium halocynthiae TaxID=560557 RepID=A0ABN2VTU8_9ACTN
MNERMQWRIKHTSGYAYDQSARASYNEARMTPLTTPEQYVLRSRVDVTPTAWSQEYRDYWGSVVTAFEVHEPHDELVVVSTSTVETSPHTDEGPEPVGWDALSGVTDEFCEFLVTDAEWTRPHPSLVELLEPLRAAAATPSEYARDALALVHERIEYLPGATEVTTIAADAWQEGHGVCQDIAHIAVGALRWAGIPARYVSGYLHPHLEPAVGETVTAESHAWVEWWDDDWTGRDPTNDVEVSQRHIVVGRGRDYADVPPLRGLYSAQGTSQLFVEVEITRLR